MNQIINTQTFRDKLKMGLSGGFLFFGDEEYLKHHYLKDVRKSVLGEDGDAVFRHRRVSALDFDMGKITEALITSSVGFFSEGKTLCEIHELNFNERKESELKALCNALSSVDPEIVYVIYATADELDAGILPKTPSKLLLRLSEYLTPVNFQKESDIKLVKWTARHFAAEKLSYETGVCELMVDRSGRDMFVLSNEIKKISAYVKFHGESFVKKEYVERVCASNLEINAFDFSNAILEADTDKAYLILSDMEKRKEKPIHIFSAVSKVISDLYAVKVLADSGQNDKEISGKLKIHEYKVSIYRKSAAKRSRERLKKLLSLCAETDVRLKSTSLSDYAVLDKLVIMSSIK